jgi:hypothetical protein
MDTLRQQMPDSRTDTHMVSIRYMKVSACLSRFDPGHRHDEVTRESLELEPV